MGRKVLAVLLVLSWIGFSEVDMLENLAFESHSTPSAFSSVAPPTRVKSVNKNVESAHHILEIYRRVDLQGTPTKLGPLCLDPGASRSHKDNCVLRI
jgi:hypothetical protein